MTATYDNFGVQFMYPENWKLSEERSDWPRTISVQSPGTAFWSLHIYSPPAEPARVTAEVLRTMQQDYNEMDFEEVSEDLQGSWAVGYDMDFCCLDLIVSSRTRSFRFGGRTFMVMWQAEDREFEQLEPVFRAMTISLLRSLHQGSTTS